MKLLKVFCVLILLLPFLTSAQTKSEDYAVMLSAKISEQPASITIVWQSNANAKSWTIYRKAKNDLYWGKALATLNATDTFYKDANVKVGETFEYQVIKSVKSDAYFGYGYIYAGIKKPFDYNRGKVLLLIDSSVQKSLPAEVERLKWDMRGDGWVVISQIISPNASVVSVRNLIRKEYDKDRKNLKSLFLLGHIPIPYSGTFAIDGHDNHEGAWPADVIYGDVDGVYTDNIVDITTAKEARNYNVPGDGKYDADVLTSDLELQVGRVDFFNMPLFTESEMDLMKRYLDKDHAWRMGKTKVEERGIVQDNFGTMSGEAFAASGFKSFAPIVGIDKVFELPYFDNLKTSSYLWSYGTGAGSFTNASGIISSKQFATDSLQTVFTMLFGSYFGDWAAENNLLRAAIANKGPILSSAWSGRPHWYFHHTALGETIGYDAWVSENNYTSYWKSTFLKSDQRVLSANLMGDPTLRIHVVKPLLSFKLENNKNKEINLSWTDIKNDVDNFVGYNIYRTTSLDTAFELINSTPTTTFQFTDANPKDGNNIYMIRTVSIKESGSGSYYNEGQGIIDSVMFKKDVSVKEMANTIELEMYPNPANELLYIKTSPNFIIERVNICDINGKEIMTIQNVTTSAVQKINLSTLTKGVYLIRISSKDASENRMFIKG